MSMENMEILETLNCEDGKFYVVRFFVKGVKHYGTLEATAVKDNRLLRTVSMLELFNEDTKQKAINTRVNLRKERREQKERIIQAIAEAKDNSTKEALKNLLESYKDVE